MFGLTSLELRLAIYGVLLAVIGGWMAYERIHLINEGEARIKSQDASAREAQKAEDAKVSKGVVDDLQNRINLLAAQPALAPPVIRLCSAPRSVRADTPASGAQSSVASASGASPSGVPEGTHGIDIGPSLQDLKRSSQVIAVYRDETYDWAVKQAKPSR